ncbi:hypothetical protein B0H13DRAFT_2361214 [Mycena leptocephala]|nr:hypothetical protein B0H13DRAFT_2361214 [Mycena leptocephala]
MAGLSCDPVPDFAPNFSDIEYGKMSYQAHHDRVKAMHLANNVSITKITHATRGLAAQTCRNFGASISNTKALGGWNESGSFKNCYDRALPVGALLGAAHFNSAKPDLYRVARDCLDLPNEILEQLFPWIEQEQAALIYTFAPFDSTVFREFATNSTAAINAAEETARLAFENLPQHMAYQAQMESMQNQMGEMKTLLELVAGSKRQRRTHGGVDDPVRRISQNLSGVSILPFAPHLVATPSFGPNDDPLVNFPPNPSLDASIAASFMFSPTYPFPRFWLLLHRLHRCLHSIQLHFLLRLQSNNSQFLPPALRPNASSIIFNAMVPNASVNMRRNGRDGDWLPHYKYVSAAAIWEYWTEWKEGMNGYISVEELNATWGGKWHRNNGGQKNEHTRRMQVINLILDLTKKPRWDIHLAQRFISDKYARQFRAPSFSDYLKGNLDVVLASAASYPS